MVGAVLAARRRSSRRRSSRRSASCRPRTWPSSKAGCRARASPATPACSARSSAAQSVRFCAGLRWAAPAHARRPTDRARGGLAERNADLQSRLTQAMAKIASQQEALRKARDVRALGRHRLGGAHAVPLTGLRTTFALLHAAYQANGSAADRRHPAARRRCAERPERGKMTLSGGPTGTAFITR